MDARGSFEGRTIWMLTPPRHPVRERVPKTTEYQLLYAYRKLNFVSLHLSLVCSSRKPAAEAMIQKIDPQRRDVRTLLPPVLISAISV